MHSIDFAAWFAEFVINIVTNLFSAYRFQCVNSRLIALITYCEIFHFAYCVVRFIFKIPVKTKSNSSQTFQSF